MGFYYLIKGMIIGFAIAAPVGPIGILCIRRTMVQGKLYGLVSGLGAATADAFYGIVAGFGLNVISSFLVEQNSWLQIIGGCFLCYLGIQTFKSKPSNKTVNIQGNSLLKAYASTLFLTIANPLTILSFIGIFAGLGLTNGQESNFYAILLVLGVFMGSALWWFFLSYLVSFLREKLNLNFMTIINRISGLILLGFGLIAVYSYWFIKI